MHRRPNPANRRWWLAVFVVALAAVVVVRVFRPVHSEDKTDPVEALDPSLVSTQALSFHLDGKAELDSVADETGSLFLNTKAERPGAPIVHSDPSPARMQNYAKEYDLRPSDGAADLNKPGVAIEVE